MAASEPALLAPAPRWPRESTMVTFAFHCNLACTFCMVEDVLNKIPGTSLEDFKKAVSDGARLEGVSRVIFSGGEVTLSKQLAQYAAFARSLPGIRHVRIQTNATRLADRTYLRSLIDAGIDEYFVSFHAPDAPLSEALVQRDGSFADIIAGIENIVAEGASLSTNTAIVAQNHTRLAEIVARIAPYRPQSMEFWNYWPRGDERGARHLAARVSDVRPHLHDALAAALRAGIPPVVKWFPRCLLGPYARYLDDAQPPALIDESYWAREPAYSCLYEGVCADAGSGCSGLSHPYVETYGWEERLLSPRRREGAGPATEVTRSLVKDAGEKRTHAAEVAAWLAQFGLAPGTVIEGFRLEGASPGRGVAMLAITFKRGEEVIELRLVPQDPARPAFTRTPSFNVIYARVPPALEPMAQKLAGALAAAITPRDAGDRSLPG